MKPSPGWMARLSVRSVPVTQDLSQRAAAAGDFRRVSGISATPGRPKALMRPRGGVKAAKDLRSEAPPERHPACKPDAPRALSSVGAP